MTGFGEAAGQSDGMEYAVEIRSVNNRYFKALIRLPEEIAGLEAEIDSQLRKRIKRGSLTCCVKLKQPEATGHRVNDVALEAYLKHLESVHARVASHDKAVQIDLTALLSLPGVLEPDDQDMNLLKLSRPIVTDLVEQACDKLTAMRDVEGAMIAEELLSFSSTMRQRLADVKGRAPIVVEEYHTRLRTRMEQLMARAELKVDERDLIREVAVFAERADINEEVSRLTGHMEQFEEVLKANDGEPAGRTLDFLSQEMLREANTIASKSNDAPISRAIVEIKSAIDRIKEQAQNVE